MSNSEFIVIANNLALDFANTLFVSDGKMIDLLDSHEDLARWLKELGIASLDSSRPFDELLQLAKELRQEILSYLSKTKVLEPVKYEATNRILAVGGSVSQLLWDEATNTHKIIEVQNQRGIEAFLYPIAQAFAKLITETRQELIKQCEAPDCILWFHDQTKSHRRRWCSMALCGNRMKAAAFRERTKHDHAGKR